jgi:hypothetical protein
MDAQVSGSAKRYRLAQNAIWVLGAHLKQVKYDVRFPVLHPDDVRNLDEEEHEAYEAGDDDAIGAGIDVGDLPKRLGKRKAKPKKGDKPEAARSETRRVVSWIWRRPAGGIVQEQTTSGVQDDLHEGEYAVTSALELSLT